MPRIEAVAVVDLPAAEAFALSQTYGEIRYRWDPFVREQHLLDGAARAAKGVRTGTTSRHGLSMVSEYVTFRPPSHVGMRMVKGPRFFDSFSGGWHFTEREDGKTEATWRYNFTCRPSWIRPVAHPIGEWLLGRDIRRRIEAFRTACADPSIMAAVRTTIADLPPDPDLRSDPEVTPDAEVAAGPDPDLTPGPDVTPAGPDATADPEAAPGPDVTPAGPDATADPEAAPGPEAAPDPEVTPRPDVDSGPTATAGR